MKIKVRELAVAQSEVLYTMQMKCKHHYVECQPITIDIKQCKKCNAIKIRDEYPKYVLTQLNKIIKKESDE